VDAANKIGLSICCLLVLAAGIACSKDRTEWFYKSLADVDKAEPSAQSWIPNDMLPATSRNLHVAGELSPSREWCAFEFSPSDSEILLKRLSRAYKLPKELRSVPSLRMAWWPSILTGNLRVERIQNAGLQLFVHEEPANAVNKTIYLFALDLKNGRGYFYSTDKQ
jgi:hypothetical protein